jgi:HAD superfamily hydrolase (TIGR01509 family)
VRSILALLKSRKFKIGLVTNSPRNYVEILFERHRLHHYFDSVITVDESKVAKPNPLMLKMACEEMNVHHKECIMIDDNEPGIIAGNKLNMVTVRVGNQKESAQYIVKNVAEILNVIERIHFQE